MSSSKEREWRCFLADMVRMAEAALDLSSDLTFETTLENEVATYGTRYAIAMMGEAANRIPKEIRDAHPEIPWRSFIDMRNILLHFYHGTKPQVVWNVVSNEIPSLIPKLEAMQEKYQ